MSKIVQFLLAAAVIVFTVSCTRADTTQQQPLFECDAQEGKCVAIWKEHHCKAMPEQMQAACYRGIEKRKRDDAEKVAQITALQQAQTDASRAVIVPPLVGSIIPRQVQQGRDNTRKSILREELNNSLKNLQMAMSVKDKKWASSEQRNISALQREMRIR